VKRSIGLFILLFPSLIILSFTSKAHSGFSLGISPVRWEAEGKPGDTLRNVVTLTSGTRAIQKVDISAVYWTLNEAGAPVFDGPATIPNSAASWVRFHPQEVTVYPRQRKTVRISIRIPEETPSGSYLVALFFQPPEAKQEGESGSASVFIRGRLALPIYVRVGNARPDGKILEAAWKTLDGKGQLPALKIHNQGNAHLRMNGFFSARSSTSMKFEGIVPGLPLLPGQIRWIPLEFQGEKPPPGSELELTLHVDLGAGERKVSMKVLQVVDNPKKGKL
jgi:fimbrial chaperone protein